MTDLDPKFSFESFVVGPANRLASAAARRAAESPGFNYNPLFICAPSGMGKTHLLGAISRRVRKIHPACTMEYRTAGEFLEIIDGAPDERDLERLRARFQSLDVFLLDDVHYLAGHPESQDVLRGILESLGEEGRQVVLTGDRPPSEVEELDQKLLDRLQGGLLVDMGPPDYETRLAILKEAADSGGATLDPRVADQVARAGSPSVRSLLDALGGILVIQERDGRSVTPDEVGEALTTGGAEAPDSGGSELGQFLHEIADSVAEKVEAQEAPWCKMLREEAEQAEAEGFRAVRLRRVMEKEVPPEDLDGLLAEFKKVLRRLDAIGEELKAVGNPWPEAARSVLKDPDRLEEAESLLASARERARLFPVIPVGPGLMDLGGEFPQLVVRAAEQLVMTERTEYNPLFVWSPQGMAAATLLQAAGRTRQLDQDGARVALISIADFASEFLKSLSAGVAGAWRERWWSADVLLIQGAQDLAVTEKVQEEFFQLLDAMHRRNARIMLASDRPPGEIADLDERLETRLQDGLVLELPVGPQDLAQPPEAPSEEGTSEPAQSAPVGEAVSAVDREWIQSFGAGSQGESTSGGSKESTEREADGLPDVGSFLSPECVIWDWPNLAERIVEASD